MFFQDNYVSADFMINHEQDEWWSFHDINSSDSSGCGGLTGPMAIIISEETPPRELDNGIFLTYMSILHYYCQVIVLDDASETESIS